MSDELEPKDLDIYSECPAEVAVIIIRFTTNTYQHNTIPVMN